jgi:MFS family permease
MVSLVSLPFIGVWVDKVPARTLVLYSIALYPLVGISYFLAGLYGMVLFLVLARVINGFNWELENISIATYYRRTADPKIVATSFGFLDTWSHVAWIGAALIGICLLPFMPIYWLLLGIAPFAVIAFFVALKAPKDSPAEDKRIERSSLFGSYGKMMTEWRTWNQHLQVLSALVFFSEVVSSLMYFFVPIDAYISGANLPMVVLITVFGAVPALFGYQLGRLADNMNKYTVIIGSLVSIALVTVGLAVFPTYVFKLFTMFAVGILLELLYMVQDSLITTLGPSETYGRRGSAFEGVLVFGDLAAPLILGVGLDLIGFPNVALVVALGAIVLALGYRLMKK